MSNIVRPNSVSINKESLSFGQAGYELSNLIAGSGLTRSGTWCTIAVDSSGDYFEYAQAPVLTFSFDTPQTLDSFALWGYYTGNLVSEFYLDFFNEDDLVLSQLFTINTTVDPDEYVNFLLDKTVVTDKVIMTLTDNLYYQLTANGGDRVGFSGIAFYQSVPEPSTWLLLIAGCGGLYFLRRKNRVSK